MLMILIMIMLMIMLMTMMMIMTMIMIMMMIMIMKMIMIIIKLFDTGSKSFPKILCVLDVFFVTYFTTKMRQ